MAFWVYGRDSGTGQPAEPFFSDANTESAARAEAGAQGIIAERVERHIESPEVPETAISATPPAAPVRPARQDRSSPVPPDAGSGWFAWVCLTVSQMLSVLGCIGAVLYALRGLFLASSRHQILGVVELAETPTPLTTLLAGACAFCYSAAMYVVFSQAKEKRRR